MLSGVRELVGAEVLVIDKDEKVRKGITQLLSAANLHVTCADDPEAGLDWLGKKFFSVVVVDLDTPSPNAGVETVVQVKEFSPTSMVIILTPRKSFGDTVLAIRAGAIDVVLKDPESVQYLKERVLEAAGRSVDKREVGTVLADVKEVHDEFLKRFMDTERRALDLSDRLAGKDPSAAVAAIDEIRVIVVEPEGALCKALTEAAPRGFTFENAMSGGEALDRCSSSRFHIAMVSGLLPDLPGSMVVSSIKTQNPELVAIEFTPPPDGKVEIVETSRRIAVVDKFENAKQLLGRLDELASAFRAKAKERRYTQAFRERHYDFLRRYVELKSKIDRALAE
jgi:DNA-binding NtrC family response regulator